MSCYRPVMSLVRTDLMTLFTLLESKTNMCELEVQMLVINCSEAEDWMVCIPKWIRYSKTSRRNVSPFTTYAIREKHACTPFLESSSVGAKRAE